MKYCAVTFDVDLQPDQIEALRLVIDGLTNQQIAEKLGIPIQIVEQRLYLHVLQFDLVKATRDKRITWEF